MRILLCLFFLLLTACAETNTYAPVTDINHIEKVPKSGWHRVAKGETLYEISWRYGFDYRKLAAWNNIKPPFTIQQNQLISLRKNHTFRQTHIPVVTQEVHTAIREPNYSVSGWRAPAQGKIIHYFSATNKGINIAGSMGEPIQASASGKVVYSGNGLRGYGNLIIIKHNNLYLSAYAHCRRVFVRDGDWVRQGQKIAEMGNTGSDKTMLHFEIRRAGKPIDPMTLLRY